MSRTKKESAGETSPRYAAQGKDKKKPAGARGRVPRLRFPEFDAAEAWQEQSLESVTERIQSKVGELVLPTVSISAGVGFVSQQEKFGRDISGDQYSNYIKLSNGDYAYNKGNSKKFPQGCIYELIEYESVAAPNAFICFRFKKGYIGKFFKGYFDQNNHGRQLAKFITSGARSDGLLNIDPKDFFSMRFATPSPSEQQKIASCLSSLDSLIVAHSQKLEALKSYKRGLMQRLFPAEGETAPRLRFPEFKDEGEWKLRMLSDVALYENGKAHEDAIEASGKFILVNARFVSTEGKVAKRTNSGLCIARKDDVMIVLSDLPNGRALARCYYSENSDIYTVNQRVARIRPLNAIGKFLYYAIDRHPFLLSFDDGMNQTHLRKDAVLNCPVRIPALPEQKKIASFLSSIDNLITAQAAQVESLKAHKRGLMQGLFPAPDEAL